MPRVRARSVGFVFQAFDLLAPLSVEDNVLFPAGLVGNRAAAHPRAQPLAGR